MVVPFNAWWNYFYTAQVILFFTRCVFQHLSRSEEFLRWLEFSRDTFWVTLQFSGDYFLGVNYLKVFVPSLLMVAFMPASWNCQIMESLWTRKLFSTHSEYSVLFKDSLLLRNRDFNVRFGARVVPSVSLLHYIARCFIISYYLPCLISYNLGKFFWARYPGVFIWRLVPFIHILLCLGEKYFFICLSVPLVKYFPPDLESQLSVMLPFGVPLGG